MKFGVMFANTGHGSSAEGAAAIARAAEAGGFNTLWTVEHVVVPSGYESKYPYDASGKMAGGAETFDLPDPLMWLSFIAGQTSRIRLGTGVLILPQRNVPIVAKEIATLDHLSGGRVTLGVGAGWLAEEFAALGVPFDDRGPRLDEHIDALRELWAPSTDPEKSTFHGRFVDFADCISRPRPASGTVPIAIGGHTRPAARRAARRGDAFMPGNGSIDELSAAFAHMEAECAEIGRDPSEIARFAMAGGKPGAALDQRIEQLAELGVSEVLVPAYRADALADIGRDLVGRFG
ncbi:MAG: LLM class F420-dependent oxidoreductase [Desertimonas sp.]